jgi:NDP-sugar pyrophosphorylase family protein
MKVVLFCGGRGTRIREYSESIPKPMIPLGTQPILRHVMPISPSALATRRMSSRDFS